MIVLVFYSLLLHLELVAFSFHFEILIFYFYFEVNRYDIIISEKTVYEQKQIAQK